jgi:hypothetical protein
MESVGGDGTLPGGHPGSLVDMNGKIPGETGVGA